jgi:hypothetical protein
MAMLQATIAMGFTTLLWIAVALMTKPESNETLQAFYERARPMGWWEPVRRMIVAESANTLHASATSTLPPEPRFLLLGGFAVAAIGAAWVAAGVLGASQLTVGNWTAATGLLIGAAAGGVLFRNLFDWHMKRLEAD